MQNQESNLFKDMFFILTEGISEALEADNLGDTKQALINAVAKTEDIYIKYTLK